MKRPEGEITPAQKILAVFGLPAESNPQTLSRFPILTVLIVILTSACSLYLLYGDRSLAELFAFYPSKSGRFNGLNYLSCFLVHGDLVHLGTNMYCLFIFGDNVEDSLGRFKYLALLIVATFLGSYLSGFMDSGSDIPHVGASGGIFGVMVYYLLRFPKAKFTYFFYFQFIQVPALAVLAMYIFLQFVGTYNQLSGLGNIDHLAHLGGGAAGLLFWGAGRISSLRGRSPRNDDETSFS
jgi:membrane associated rhomboid family serine protease